MLILKKIIQGIYVYMRKKTLSFVDWFTVTTIIITMMAQEELFIPKSRRETQAIVVFKSTIV